MISQTPMNKSPVPTPAFEISLFAFSPPKKKKEENFDNSKKMGIVVFICSPLMLCHAALLTNSRLRGCG